MVFYSIASCISNSNVFLLPYVELRTLATLLGPYGMKYLGERMLQQIENNELRINRNEARTLIGMCIFLYIFTFCAINFC